MFTDAFPGATRLRIVVVCALAVTMLLMPSLVRASESLRHANANAPIRLNRGFEKPPSKAVIVPPVDSPSAPPICVVDPPIRSTSITTTANEPLPAVTWFASPDPLRGPPLRSRS